MKLKIFPLLFFFSFSLGCLFFQQGDAFAQFYQGSQMTFGKNRVQYNDFLWTFYRLKRFDTYFYVGGQPLALFTNKTAAEEIEKIEKVFDYRLEKRIQFIIFNKLSDMKQSNIGLSGDEQYNIGGVTKIIGSKVFLYFEGDHKKLREQIRAGIAKVLITQLLYGGDIKDMLQNATLLTLPDWYVSGLVSYIAKEWSVEIDNRVKDGIQTGKYKKFNRLGGIDAVYAGHSIWKYIVESYGDASLANILYMTRINRNIENGFSFVLGTSSKSLSKSWLVYYQEKYKNADDERTFPETGLLKKKAKKGCTFTQLKISPDGNRAAFVRNDMGKYKVFLYDFKKQKTKKVMKAGYKSTEQAVDESFPLLAWHPNGKMLSIIREKKGKRKLAYYYPDTKKKEESPLFNIEKILDFAYSDDGLKLVLSAVQKGQSDIYIYNLRSHVFEPVTNDIYDDFNPHFTEHSTKIIFSSNRNNDTLKTSEKDTLPLFAGNLDIFEYNYKEKSNILKRITSTPLFNEIHAAGYDSSTLLFLSDENGIFNRFAARLDSTISFIDTTEHYRDKINVYPLTNYSRNIIVHDINPKAGKYAEILYSKGRYKMFVNDLQQPDTAAGLFHISTTYRKNTLLSPPETIDTVTLLSKKDTAAVDTTTLPSDLTDVMEPLNTTDSSKIDINNYVFQSDFPHLKDKKKKNQKEQNVVTETPNINEFTADSTLQIKSEFSANLPPKQRNYETAFSTNYVVTQLDNSLLSSTYQFYTGGGAVYFNPGLNALFKIGISDLFEDYRIVGGFRVSGNFGSNEYFISFEDLKKRLDKQLVFYRQGRSVSTPYNNVKVHTHEIKYNAKWPFNDIASVRGTLAYRNDRSVSLSTDIQNLERPNVYLNWGSAKMEFVFDNTISRGLTLYNGVRYKVFAEVFKQDKKETTFFVAGADFRYYQKIYKDLIWANRFAASTSFGKQKLIYYLGSLDNWFSPKFDNSTSIDNTQNYVYQTLATPLRGFYQNARNGSSFALANTELRIPVFKLLFSRPIKSDFIKNFQVACFSDIGTAWTGYSPYDSTNSLNKQVVKQGPLTITLYTSHEPIIAGYGWGLRSRVLGYFIRMDWAWGIEDGEKKPRIFYFSLNLDF